jgi:N4-(beta-N-acetylglucosaminyl)-L-asparaginase
MAYMSRRDFVRTGMIAGLTSRATVKNVLVQGPAVLGGSVKPVVIASRNGNRSRNGSNATCIEEAFRLLTTGSDVLDALLAGVNIVENDPEDTTVGYGGLPNADGIVQLDACCMHGPSKRAGGVGALEGVRTPSLVAKAVMDHTDHHLLVGSGAQEFARNMGFEIESDLNTPLSRELWLDWKRRTDPKHYTSFAEREAIGTMAGLQMVTEGLIGQENLHGTINCCGLSPKGELAGVTTTSGRAWKIPGRLGDSPILGAGLYVDGDIGATGSTGRGEANLYGLCSFLIVENMRNGMSPKDAGMEALKRIRTATIEDRLLNNKGEPNFNINFYVLNALGEHAGVGLYSNENSLYSVCTNNGADELPIEPLLPGSQND